MYTPKSFKKDDPELMKDFIRQNGFGILVSEAEGKLLATHIPILLSEQGDKLHGHIARGNKQWKDFNNGAEALCIFSGPHAYVSSSWYDHENVSTWNYIAVHVYGTISVIEGDKLYNSLKALTDKYEKHSEHPVSVESLSPSYLKREMPGVTGFEIEITKMEATYKLSQNRDDKNHAVIVTHLERAGDENARQVALAMKKERNKL